MSRKYTKMLDKIISFKTRRDLRGEENREENSKENSVKIVRKIVGKKKNYRISADTLEAIQIKTDYLDGKISDDDLTMYFLRLYLLGI